MGPSRPPDFNARLGVHDRHYARVCAAVTEQWNKMTNAVAVELTTGALGYIGQASAQLKDENISNVFLIGGEYLIRRVSILTYQKPNAPFGTR